MNSVTLGRAMVVDAAVERAVAQPLHESVRAAAERSAEQSTRGKDGSMTQTPFGMDVTELVPKLGELSDHD